MSVTLTCVSPAILIVFSYRGEGTLDKQHCLNIILKTFCCPSLDASLCSGLLQIQDQEMTSCRKTVCQGLAIGLLAFLVVVCIAGVVIQQSISSGGTQNITTTTTTTTPTTSTATKKPSKNP